MATNTAYFGLNDNSFDLDQNAEELSLLSMPDEILENVLSFLSYDEASESRLVCHRFNRFCEHMLNQGFSRVDKLHAQIQKNVKSQLPRRESERRNHPLARHVDILSAIETRLSLLGMTYMRYIDMALCCFIPGKVLDELFRILGTLQKSTQPPRAHEFLQELRDISSMAMEHFEEKIAPALKAKMPAVTLPFPFGDTSSPEPQPGTSSQILTIAPSPNMRGPSIRQEIIRLQNQMRSQSASIIQCKKEAVDCKNKFNEQRKRALDQEKKIQGQNKIIAEQGEIITEQEKKVSDLSKKILEYDQKFADVYSELSKLKGENFHVPSSSSSGSVSELNRKDSGFSSEEILPDRRTRKDNLKRKGLREDISDKPKKVKH